MAVIAPGTGREGDYLDGHFTRSEGRGGKGGKKETSPIHLELCRFLPDAGGERARLLVLLHRLKGGKEEGAMPGSAREGAGRKNSAAIRRRKRRGG